MKVGLFLSCYPELDDRQAPLGLGYLAAYAQKYVGPVEFIIERDIDRLIEAKPDIVGFTLLTKTVPLATRQAERVKQELGCPILCGGPHISALPSSLDYPFDVAVLGEGEQTFAELLHLFHAEKQFATSSLAKIKGIAYRADAKSSNSQNRVIQTEARPFFENLDVIPQPNRKVLLDKWPHPNRRYTMMTSRGCPYHCAFCSTTLHWGGKYRYHSKEYVAAEIESIRNEWDPLALDIWDDLFIANKARVLDLLGHIRQKGLHEGLEFTGFVRANLLDDEIMESLAQTNFHLLNIGFESCSDEVLETLNKQGVRADTNRRAAELARRYGARFSSTFILGSPGETRDDITATFEFIGQNLDIFSFVQFVPLEVMPGTRVWEWARELGISEENLHGVLFEAEDLSDRKNFYMNRWPYLNEKNIPREELYNYLRFGDQLSAIVSQMAGVRQEMNHVHQECASRGSAEYAADNIAITDILRAKINRRMRKISGNIPNA